jgi:hypothetical protein
MGQKRMEKIGATRSFETKIHEALAEENGPGTPAIAPGMPGKSMTFECSQCCWRRPVHPGIPGICRRGSNSLRH